MSTPSGGGSVALTAPARAIVRPSAASRARSSWSGDRRSGAVALTTSRAGLTMFVARTMLSAGVSPPSKATRQPRPERSPKAISPRSWPRRAGTPGGRVGRCGHPSARQAEQAPRSRFEAKCSCATDSWPRCQRSPTSRRETCTTISASTAVDRRRGQKLVDDGLGGRRVHRTSELRPRGGRVERGERRAGVLRVLRGRPRRAGTQLLARCQGSSLAGRHAVADVARHQSQHARPTSAGAEPPGPASGAGWSSTRPGAAQD